MVSALPSTVFAAAMGVGSYINSMSAGNRGTATSLLGALGAQWTRLEVAYSTQPDWAPLDDAVSKVRGAGINIILLLAYQANLSQDDWKVWVTTLAQRYGGQVQAWEIFNEADNALSGAAYADYLKNAHPIIKAANSSATVIVSGVNARQQANSFWNGIWDAGAGGSFDALGLHPYRSSAPEVKEFNSGNFVDSLKIATSNIAAHGGGKSVWITEFGWRDGTVGAADQADHLGRAFALAATVSGVEAVTSFNLYDNAEGGSYGLLNGDYSKKTAYGVVQGVIGNLKGKGFSEYVDASSSQVVADFEGGVGGWETKETNGGSLNLGVGDGKSGKGMTFAYNFSDAAGYAVAKKSIPLAGQPTAFKVWINASSASSVWKFRIKDANGETFQFDTGSSKAGWNQYTFDIATDKAQTSWGGDGVLNYPVGFDSIVFDNQGGSSSGAATVDDLTIVNGGSDLYALRFGSTLAYWKVSGSAQASVCGQTLNFTQTPQFAAVSSCPANPAGTTTSAPGQSSAAPRRTTVPTATPGTKAPSKEKSAVTLDKGTAFADGKDTIIITVTVKDEAGNAVEGTVPTVIVSGDGNEIGTPVLEGGAYKILVTSRVLGSKTITVKVGELELAKLEVEFKEIPPSAVTVVKQGTSRWVLAGGFGALALGGIGGWLWLYFRKFHHLPPPPWFRRRGLANTSPALRLRS